MKRLLSLLCASALALSLTACSRSGGTDNPNTPASSESQGELFGSSESQPEASPSSGENSPGGAPGGLPPAPPDGTPDGSPPAPPDGTPPSPPDGGPSGTGGGFGGSGTVNQGTAAHTIDADHTDANDSYTSDGDDENALRVDGVSALLNKVTVNKTGGNSSNTEDGDFYGLNAAVLAANEARLTMTDCTVRSDALNGNGVFCYGEGTKVTLENTSITTTGDHSGGIQTTGGGSTEAFNLNIQTSGSSSAAIRTDRGGGEVEVAGGTYVTGGLNSPAVYSTADIEVKDAVLTANASEALVVEGKNSIELENCSVSGNMSDQGSSAGINLHNVMLYQSMSGDAETGTSKLSIEGGSLTCIRGDQFFVTNTRAEIDLDGVALSNRDPDGRLLVVTGNDASRGWGTAGANGAQVTLEAEHQALEGDILVDSISQLDLRLEDGSSLTGTITILDNAEGGTAVRNNAVVTIGTGCTWTLTGDCLVDSVDVEDGGNIEFNGHVIALTSGSTFNMAK